MSDPHPGDFIAPPRRLESEEAEEEGREPGALAPRKLPGYHLSEAAGAASDAFASSSVDFGFGNSWSHIPIPVGDGFDAHHHSPHAGEGLHEPQGGGGAGGGRDASPRAAQVQCSDDDKVVSDPYAKLSVPHSNSMNAASREAPPASAVVGAGAGRLEQTLGYDHDATSTPSLAEVERRERLLARSSGASGSTGGDTPHGCASPTSGRPTTPTEPVSLPDDIYGAARVSEYWHGVPGLSSLASAYVYDDIWAGDGGLNPR